jgi:cytochrome c biogenesis protein CcdA
MRADYEARAQPRPVAIRFLPLLVGSSLGSVWFLLFHYRIHAGLVTGAGPIIDAQPGLLVSSAPAFFVAFTVGSAAIWMPCILQMVLVFSGVASGEERGFRGGRFFAGYIATYALLGLTAAIFGTFLAQPGSMVALQIAGGIAIAIVGLYLAGVLKNGLLKACGSALGFAMKGGRLHRLSRASTGVAFAIYCAGCCGPLLIPLYVFVAASGSLVLGAVMSAGFALAMAIPIAILGALGHRSVSFINRVMGGYDVMSRTAGVALLMLGSLLALTQPLALFIDSFHHFLGE